MQYSQTISATAAIRNRNVVQETTDESLVASIAQGDKRALQTLYGRHSLRVFRFVLRFLNDESMAEDMVSEVFLDVWRQAARFEARSKVSTWLLAMARNKALSVLRRRSTEELDGEMAETIKDHDDDQGPAFDPYEPLGGWDRRRGAHRHRDSERRLRPAHRHGDLQPVRPR